MPRSTPTAIALLLLAAAQVGGCGDAREPPSGRQQPVIPMGAVPRDGDAAERGDVHAAVRGEPAVGVGGTPSDEDAAAVPTVRFSRPESSVREPADTTAALAVELNRPAPSTVRVAYAVTYSQARDHGRCSPRDYTLSGSTLVFNPGETRKTIPLTVHDDSLAEGDEAIVAELTRADGARLGPRQTTHVLAIVDDDRENVVSVKDYGARGDGETDDTGAIQEAVDSLYEDGGGVLYFPPGTYVVTQVAVEPGITYFGYGATLLRPADQGKWTRTFTTQDSRHKSDTRPLVVQGLTFNGNSQQQGSYRRHQLEQGHLLFLTGNTRSPERIQAYVEDVRFEDGVGDGVSVYTNVDARICHVRARDVFRGGFVLTGGDSSAYVYDLVTEGPRDRTGIDVEVDSSGYGGRRTEITLERVQLDGDFDIAVNNNSIVRVKDLTTNAPPFYILSSNSTVLVSDSKLWIGYNDSYINRIVVPGSVASDRTVVFDHVDFHLTKDKEGDRDLHVFDVYEFEGTGQTIRARNSAFHVADTIGGSDRAYVANSPGEGNRLIIDGGWIDPKFDAVFAPGCTTCVHNESAGDGAQPGRREVTYDDGASGIGGGGGAAGPLAH